MNADIRYSIVIPVYNEEAVIDQTYQRLKQVMDSTKDPYELIFVNDGSCDHTTAKIKGFRDQDDAVKLITFSRNFGHQIAITAGMDYASGAAVVVIDADLQAPPAVVRVRGDGNAATWGDHVSDAEYAAAPSIEGK